jgi:hypothetical protein
MADNPSPQQLAAEREAAKREAHKPRSLTHKRWSAVHDSTHGWHIALVDNHPEIIRQAEVEARRALMRGDPNAVIDAAGDLLMARVRAFLAPTSEITRLSTKE